MADVVTSPTCPYQFGLATLLGGSGDLVPEPESGLPYRLRIIGGDQINDVIAIVLDDLERVFESEEEHLSKMTLKMCINW